MSVSYRTVLITDPCYVNNTDNYQDYIAPTIKHDDINTDTTILKNYIPLKITKALYDSLSKALLVPSALCDEEFYLFGHHENSDNAEITDVGVNGDLDKYIHVGTHHSDSGMTCVIDEDPFKLLNMNNQNDSTTTAHDNTDKSSTICEEVDWQDFVLSTLSDESTQPVDRDSFPLYLWYGRIPNGGSAIQVHVRYDDDGVVEGILLKADIDHDEDEGIQSDGE